MTVKKPIVLAVLDGWGEWDTEKGNPLKVANLPTIKMLDEYYPKSLLQASGLSVGLPWGAKGNSEVGHQTMGVGQILFQYLPAINMAIQNKAFGKNKVLNEAFEKVKKNKSCLHLMGLLSDGGVHSHIDHLFALIEEAKKNKIKDLYIHVFADGRDAAPKSIKIYLEKLIKVLDEHQVGKIASISGRYYAMDRNNNWDRIEKSFLAFTEGTRIKEKDPFSVVDGQYNRGITDEYFEPVALVDDDMNPVGLVKEDDVVICFNYRKDRSRQLLSAFSQADFSDFEIKRPNNMEFICFTEYEEGTTAKVLFPPQKITTRLGGVIAEQGKKQLRIAETEKFAHVTFFFNGGLEEPFSGEDRILIPSKNVASYDKLPEMSAKEVTDKLLEALTKNDYDFVLVNYANPDMVGHSGDYKATVKAVETVDECLKKLIDKIISLDGCLLITSDHGNVEEMINLFTYEKDTEHSTNPVPCWLVGNDKKREEPWEDFVPNIDGMIVDLAPTVLDLMGLEKPRDMIGRSLLDLMN